MRQLCVMFTGELQRRILCDIMKSIIAREWSTEKTMQIREIINDKKQYLDLLLLADEQEDMIDRYLERGTMYVLEEAALRRSV